MNKILLKELKILMELKKNMKKLLLMKKLKKKLPENKPDKN
jgi:hypothetical protein